jgi:uncharacterized protein (DUF885 family)
MESGPNSNQELADLSEEFYQVMHSTDPFSATMLGVSGFDGLVPDPSRAGAQANAGRFRAIEDRLETIDTSGLAEADQINHAVLAQLAWGARSDLEHGVWETSASAAGYAAPQALVFQSVPAVTLTDSAAVDAYLQRLGGVGGYFDAIMERYREAKADGRISTRAGVEQAIDQLEGHLALSLDDDTLLSPRLPDDVDSERVRARARAIVEGEVRPAMGRLLTGLREELLPGARGDDRVGLKFVPGGEEAYRAAVRRQTTTDLTPDQVHQIGLDTLDSLQAEWAELGGRVLGTRDVAGVRQRLREDRTLRFNDTSEIVAMVSAALARSEATRDDWFPAYRIAECVIEEINPVEARNAALAHYRPPAGDGSRPGAHCILTTNPRERFIYEYEALAFHESSPGHHLQIATAQSLKELPTYRRFLDGEVCAFIEGWGLYAERLADEMGLYTSDLQRLGMLSFDALRACRLVVDTGMHHLGWSRQQAMDFMWNNTATTRENVSNEINRYVAWPGQALAYMIGRREIRRLRDLAQQRLGAGFDPRQFHGVVLGNGAVPLGVLEQVVNRWLDQAAVS